MAIFTRHIHTVIDIDAPPPVVWQILLDLDRYADWNPMLSDVQTDLRIGTGVRFKAARPDGGELKLSARITSLQPEQELVWKGGSDWLLSGEHYFRLQPLANGGCHFEHGELFRGPLVPLARPFLKDGEQVYQSMNEALRERAQQTEQSEEH